MSEESRRLVDLRVVDLRSELEKRDLDKSGNKQILLERLQKAMENEGLDPETYLFETEKKSTKRPSTSSNQIEADVNHKDKIEESSENTDDKVTEKHATFNTDNKDDTKNDEKVDKTEENEANTELTVEENVTAASEITSEEKEACQDETSEPLVQNESEEKEMSAQEDVKKTTSENDETEKKTTSEDEEKTDGEAQVEIKKGEASQTEDNVASVTSSNTISPFTFSKKTSENRNLWITNISQNTRATELKQILAAYGKVVGAKVVINAKYPGACCYGYVTMETVQDAENCIAKLNNTELNGQIICVEKVRPDHMITAKLNPKLRSDEDAQNKQAPVSAENAENVKNTLDAKESDDKTATDNTENKNANQLQSQDGKNKPTASEKIVVKRPKFNPNKKYRNSNRRSRSSERAGTNKSKSKSIDSRGEHGILTFDKIKEERERQRLREKERLLREENRRRHKEATRQREVDRLQRLEATRLERERAKLRLEREKLERDKAEIIRLERDRHKLEREKLELEKLELQRVRIRLQEEDRGAKRSHSYRREGSYERKRSRHYGDTFDLSSSGIPKDAHYSERGDSYQYRRDERDRRAVADHKASSRDRYSQGKDSHHLDRNTALGMNSRTSTKVFTPIPGTASLKSWGANINRWPSSGIPRTMSSIGFPVTATTAMIPPGSALPSINNLVADKFDFKTIQTFRKY